MRLFRAGLLALALMAAVAVPARAAFLPIAPIDDGAGAGKVTAASLAVLPDGSALAAWLQERCATTDMACRRAACPTGDTACQALPEPPNPVRIWASVLQGGAWSPPQPLAVGQGDVTSPAAALATAGTGVVAFIQSDGTHDAVWAARVSGGTFAATQRLDDVAGNAAGTSVAADAAGRLTVVWSQFRSARWRVVARRYQAGAWGAVALVDTGAGTGSAAGAPKVAARDGAVLVAWAQASGVKNRIYAARHDGAAWQAPVAVDAETGGTADTPVVGLTSAAQGVIAFRQLPPAGEAGPMRLYAARMQAGAFEPAERMDVGTGSDAVNEPALSVDPVSGSALVAWSQRDSVRRKIHARRLVGAVWGLPATLDASLATGDAFSPSVALRSGGNGIAAWYAYEPADRGYRIKASSLVDGVWTDPIDVGPASGVPLIGTTDSGDNIALWFFNDGTRDRIGASPDDRTPPSIELDPIVTLSGRDTPLEARVLGDALSGLERVEWSFGDGTPVSNDVKPVHLWAASGSYSVSLTATDRAGNTATARTTATVDDGTPPVLDAGPDVRVFVGREVAFHGTATDDDAGIDEASVRWSLVGSTQTTQGYDFTATFPGEGVYSVRFEAKDRAGNLATDVVTVTARIRPDDDIPPRVDAGPDLTVPLGAPLRLTGTVADAESGVDEATVQWIIDDGAAYTGREATHRFTTRGDHVARLRAMDMAENVGEDAIIVHVGPDTAPPEIDAGPDRVVEIDTDVELVGTTRDDGSGVDPDSVHWSLPGGIERPGARTTERFPTPGRVVAILHAADLLGNAGTDEVAIIVTPVGGDHDAPVVDAGRDLQAWAGVPVALAGLADDPGGVGVDPASVRWLVDGTEAARGLEATLTAPTPGQRELRLEAKDWVGNVGQDTAILQVNLDGAAPSVDAGPDLQVAPGATVDLAGTASDAESGIQPGSLRWTFDDGSSADGAAVRRTFTREGVRTATFQARDNAGNLATDTVRVVVGAGTVGGPGPTVRTAATVVAWVRDRVTLHATVRAGQAPVASVRWRFANGTTRDGKDVTRTFAKVGRQAATVTVTDTARRAAQVATTIDVRRLTVKVVSIRRVRGRIVVRVRPAAPGSVRVRVRVGRRTIVAKPASARRAKPLDVHLPKGVRIRRGKVLVLVALARPTGAKAAARKTLRLR